MFAGIYLELAEANIVEYRRLSILDMQDRVCVGLYMRA